jgi:hypothetical protein
MTKKDYIKFAEAIRLATREDGSISKMRLIDEMSYIFREDNPNFDSIKFLEAAWPNK